MKHHFNFSPLTPVLQYVAAVVLVCSTVAGCGRRLTTESWKTYDAAAQPGNFYFDTFTFAPGGTFSRTIACHNAFDTYCIVYKGTYSREGDIITMSYTSGKDEDHVEPDAKVAELGQYGKPLKFRYAISRDQLLMTDEQGETRDYDAVPTPPTPPAPP